MIAPAFTSSRAVLALVLASVALVAACGGGDKKDGSGARAPTDPRRVPTGTVPADLPPPLAALDAGGGRPQALPTSYVVKAGDTLNAIAGELGVSADELTRANPSINPASLRIGQELQIPRPSPTATATAAIRGPASPTAGARTSTPNPTTAAGTTTRTPTPTGTAARTPTPAGTAAATATATRTATPAATSAAGTYTVESGDTACAIAKKLGVSLTALAQANGSTVDGLASLRVGQVLQVPRSTGESAGC